MGRRGGRIAEVLRETNADYDPFWSRVGMASGLAAAGVLVVARLQRA